MRGQRGFRKDRSGVAAVEFALILPLMIMMFFGVVELSMALSCRADVSVMASTAADLISQESVATNTDLANVYAAAGTILYPYYDPSVTGAPEPTIRITSVIYDTTTNSTTAGKISWTCAQAGSGTLTPASRAIGDTVTLPQALLTSGGSVIIAEVAYNYASPTTQIISGPINMTNNFWTKPRRVPQITAPTSCT
jgi:Flp pilus assembly protein TadG